RTTSDSSTSPVWRAPRSIPNSARAASANRGPSGSSIARSVTRTRAIPVRARGSGRLRSRRSRIRPSNAWTPKRRTPGRRPGRASASSVSERTVSTRGRTGAGAAGTVREGRAPGTARGRAPGSAASSSRAHCRAASAAAQRARAPVSTRAYSVNAATARARMTSEAAAAGSDWRSRRGPTVASERLAQGQVETEPVEERAPGSEVRRDLDQRVGLCEVQGAPARSIRVVGEVEADGADHRADPHAHPGRDAPAVEPQVREVAVFERPRIHEPGEPDTVGGDRGRRAQLQVDDRQRGPAGRDERDVVGGHQRVAGQRIDLDAARDVDPRAEPVAREAPDRGRPAREEAVLRRQEVAVRDERRTAEEGAQPEAGREDAVGTQRPVARDVSRPAHEAGVAPQPVRGPGERRAELVAAARVEELVRPVQRPHHASGVAPPETLDVRDVFRPADQQGGAEDGGRGQGAASLDPDRERPGLTQAEPARQRYPRAIDLPLE